MVIIKLFLIFILSVIFLLLALSSKFRTYQRLTIMFIYGFLAFFIIYPQKADRVAAFFGIGRGVDLIIYLSIAVLSLIVAILYAKVKINERALTKIVRELAIMQAKKCNE